MSWSSEETDFYDCLISAAATATAATSSQILINQNILDRDKRNGKSACELT